MPRLETPSAARQAVGASRRAQSGSGRAALVVAVALFACGGGEETGGGSSSVPPQQPLAGLHGLRTQSRVVFAAAPESPHRLTTVQAFPGRGLWRLEPEAAGTRGRRLRYRLGSEVYEVSPGQGDSVRLEGQLATDALLDMELRAAALLWPEGHPWTPGQDPDRIELEGLGSLEARGAGAAPTELRALRADGSELERLEAIEWQREGDRSWPRCWVLSSPEGPIWREEILERSATGRYADLYFVPPDRLQPGDSGREEPFDSGVVQQVVIPARVVLAFELPEGASLEEALAAAATERDRRRTAVAPAQIEARVELELDAAAGPRRGRLRMLGEATGPAPPGWERLPLTTGASQLLSRPGLIDAGRVAALRAALPEPGLAERPYLLVQLDGGTAEPAQLVLPLRHDR